jgi:uncharacterized protein YqgC (DUF456 family)
MLIMDIFLLIIGLAFVLIGIVGSVLPVIPGPPIGWVGVLLLYLTKAVPMDYWAIGITLFLAILVSILDYIIPALGTKKFGGTKYGMWGTTIGLVIGFFIPIPLGFLIGSVIGAFIGEMLYDSKDTNRATKAAVGSFIGFVGSTFLKLVLTFGYLIWFVKIAWEYRLDFI